MRKAVVLFMISASLICCKKKEDVNNNYITIGSPKPAFTINGISDVVFINNFGYSASMALSVEYQDSVQENVTLDVSGLPDGIMMDTTWISSGIPTFSTTLNLFDTNAVGVAPGIYATSITATTASGKKKTYPFNIKVQGMPTTFLGAYNTCTTMCGGPTTFKDSLYADATVRNKVWFNNFAGTGPGIYGLIGNAGKLTIPMQTVGGNNYSGTANLNLQGHQMVISCLKNSASCSVNMR